MSKNSNKFIIVIINVLYLIFNSLLCLIANIFAFFWFWPVSYDSDPKWFVYFLKLFMISVIPFLLYCLLLHLPHRKKLVNKAVSYTTIAINFITCIPGVMCIKSFLTDVSISYERLPKTTFIHNVIGCLFFTAILVSLITVFVLSVKIKLPQRMNRIEACQLRKEIHRMQNEDANT